MPPQMYRFFATAPRGAEYSLEAELQALGAENIHSANLGVAFRGTLKVAYQLCLRSRIANRVLLELAELDGRNPDALYQSAYEFDWPVHMTVDTTFAIRWSASQKASIQHGQFAIQRLKDAIVDQFRQKSGRRPIVERNHPDLWFNLALLRDKAVLSIDLVGESLHRRHYRVKSVDAPLKENVAAAVLHRAGWHELAQEPGVCLVDPMCGSGTLVIEAAMIAAQVAPGRYRHRYSCESWLGHDVPTWKVLREQIQNQERSVIPTMPKIFAFDESPQAVKAARACIAQAGFSENIIVELRELGSIPRLGDRGLIVCNPPYGERLGGTVDLDELYRKLGSVMRERFEGWQGAILTGAPSLGLRLGISARKRIAMSNGPIDCQLLTFDLSPSSFYDGKGANEKRERSPGADAFCNRLKKNLRQLKAWRKRERITCYRAYDADLPDFALAVDVYGERVHVQEYAAPDSIDPKVASQRLREGLAVIREVFGVERDHVAVKRRQRQRGGAQYEKVDDSEDSFIVREEPCVFWVNIVDYLDTGLFLDHRPTRYFLAELARGRHVLNLFAYTGTATVHMAKAGAISSTSVDASRTYQEWSKRNFALNRLDPRDHKLVLADCLQWLEHHQGERFDLIFVDPPTFSNSKGQSQDFSIQRDHVELLARARTVLKPNGDIIFSTHARKFRLDEESLQKLGFDIEDITKKTIDRDFARSPRIHYCYHLHRRERP